MVFVLNIVVTVKASSYIARARRLARARHTFGPALAHFLNYESYEV